MHSPLAGGIRDTHLAPATGAMQQARQGVADVRVRLAARLGRVCLNAIPARPPLSFGDEGLMLAGVFRAAMGYNACIQASLEHEPHLLRRPWQRGLVLPGMWKRNPGLIQVGGNLLGRVALSRHAEHVTHEGSFRLRGYQSPCSALAEALSRMRERIMARSNMLNELTGYTESDAKAHFSACRNQK